MRNSIDPNDNAYTFYYNPQCFALLSIIVINIEEELNLFVTLAYIFLV